MRPRHRPSGKKAGRARPFHGCAACLHGTARTAPILTLLPLTATALSGEELDVSAASGPSAVATSASLTVVPLGPGTPPGTDVAAAIDSASGTTVRRLGGLGDFAAVSLRGSSYRHVEVFLDGVPLNPDGSTTVDLSELPVSAFERLEIYRGNAPAAFGSSAMGGVVNLVTPEGRALPPAVGLAAGSWGTGRAFGVAGPSAGAVDTLLAVDQLHTEGDWPAFDDRGTEYNRLDDHTVVRANNAIDRTSVLARARFGPPAWRFTLLDSFARSHQELPGPLFSPAALASFTGTRNLVVASAHGNPGERWGVTPRAWALWRRADFDDRASEIGVGPEWTRGTYVTAGAQTEAVWAPRTARGDGIIVTGLVRGRRDSVVPENLLTGLADGERARLAGTASIAVDARLGPVTLSPVVQLELLDNRLLGEVPFASVPVAPEGEDFGAYVLPRAGALVRPWAFLALKANAGLYMRPPDFTELFGEEGTIIGNTELVPETGWSWDAGARIEHVSHVLDVSLDLAYARNRAHDLIVFVQNSQFTQTPINVGEASVQSTEAALEADLLDVLRSSSNVTWTVSRNLVDDPAYVGNELPRLPPIELAQRTSLRWDGRVEFAHTWSYAAATWADTTNVYRSAPRSLHGASLAVTPVVGLPTVRAEVLNLLDVRGMAVDRNPLSGDDALVVKPLTDFSGYPLPGRTVLVSLTWSP